MQPVKKTKEEIRKYQLAEVQLPCPLCHLSYYPGRLCYPPTKQGGGKIRREQRID